MLWGQLTFQGSAIIICDSSTANVGDLSGLKDQPLFCVRSCSLVMMSFA